MAESSELFPAPTLPTTATSDPFGTRIVMYLSTGLSERDQVKEALAIWKMALSCISSMQRGAGLKRILHLIELENVTKL